MWLLMLVVQEPLADGGVGARGVASLLEFMEWERMEEGGGGSQCCGCCDKNDQMLFEC
jgi:hypothetical protein